MDSTYVKLEYERAVEIKKEMLKCQINFLNTIKSISKYNLARKKETIHKIKLRSIAKNIKKNIIQFKKFLPKVKKEEPEFIKEKKQEEKLKDYNNVDSQLNEIREKLRELSYN